MPAGGLARTWDSASKSTGNLAGLTMSLSFPTNADEYELTEECGRGVSATVWRAFCMTLEREVAVKLLDLESVNCSLEEIIREAQTMRQQAHANVLPLYCSFVHNHNLWMVMPYVSGGSVLNIMKYAYPEGLEEPVIATILKEVLKGLDYVHRQGNIHRDVKAGNILIDANGQVMLADFGVAATMERGGSWGNQNMARNTFVGTPCWMAPEVMEQTTGYNSLADIWSFGITILELAHGHAPFARFPPMKVLLMTIQNPPPTLDSASESAKKHFSKAMRDIVAKCLMKDPGRRPTAAQLLEHKFFKTAHDPAYLVKHLLAGLPDVTTRVHQMRQSRTTSGSNTAADKWLEMEASKEAYVKGVSSWDFDVAELKAAAEREEPSLPPISEAATLAPEAAAVGNGADAGRSGLMVDVPGAAGARPPLPSPASAAPLRAASPGPFGAPAAGAGAPLARGLAGSGGSGNFSASALTRQSTGGGAGLPMKPGHKKQGRFEVYEEGNAPPPLSPVVGNGAALLEAAMKPATPDAAGPRSTASMDGGASEPASRAPSESLEGDAADKSKEAKRKGRFQIVEDDFGDSKARVGRSTSATNVGDGRPGSSAGGGEGGRPGASAAALLPALKEVASGLGAQYDLMKELVHAVQDTERGRHASLSTLLEEVRERVSARAPRDELERARTEATALREENVRLRERLRVMEEELSRMHRAP